MGSEPGSRSTLIITPAGLAAIGIEPPKPAEQSDEDAAPTTPVNTGGTKTEIVLALLRRQNGASIAEMMAATGWQAHSVRGFMSGQLKRRGLPVISDKGEDGTRRYFIAPIKSAGPQ